MFRFPEQDSRSFDENGGEHEASRLMIANRETRKFGQGVTMVSRVRTPSTISFENVRPPVRRISLLEIKGFARNWYTVRFRNVPVTE